MRGGHEMMTSSRGGNAQIAYSGRYHVRGGHRMILLFRGVCAHEVSNGEVVAATPATFDAVSLRRPGGLGWVLLLPRSYCSLGPTAT